MINKQIKEERERQGITQAELAEKAGVSESHLSRYESGKKDNPGIQFLGKIVHALGKKLMILIK